ncbi:MAG: ATP-binding protein [Deltaproteobacteria bacterium]|nr:ATP-binding protein [Deltaproteobacteria bacterium]
MTEFVGRTRELEALQKAWQQRASAFFPIYGRRRVGKSELILRFLRDKPGIYFVGSKAPGDRHRRQLLQEAAGCLQEPLLADYAARDWRAALTAVVDRWKGPGKLAIVLDEFQWTAEASPDLPSVLQELWDRDWSKSGKVFLILCGSFLGFMEREVLGKKSPLYGRRTGQILLQPFGYAEAAKFHPRWSAVDHARARFLCGGIPLYLRCLDDSLSVEHNLQDRILDEFSVLFREPEFLLREELREVESYHAVLTTVAAGTSSAVEIARESGVDRSVAYYLDQLASLGYVERRYPLTDRPAPRRNVRFVLSDPLLRFWFRFVFPTLSFLRHAGPVRTLREKIRPELDSFFGVAFERLCREALPALYRSEGVNASYQIGDYWAPGVQIDVVGLRDDNVTDLGECKWGAVRSVAAVAQELKDRLPLYDNRRNATISPRIFLRNPVRSAPSWCRVHSLEDLYRAGR